MSPEMKITVVEDGPYLVTGGVPLAEELIICDNRGTPVRWEPGRTFPMRETYSLCRCGKSRQKPFCDGSHTEAGFRGRRQAPDEDYFNVADQIEGPGVTLYDHTPLCAKVGFCHRGGNVWQLAATRSDRETVDLVIDNAHDCASGRLVAAKRKSGETIERDLEPSISLVQIPAGHASGPIWVKGGIPIVTIEGWTYSSRNRVTLCRCGATRNMPFCDASHTKIDFNDGSETVR